MVAKTELNKILENLINRKIEITIVHHVEGTHLRTVGILKEITPEIIRIEIDWKEHWYSKKSYGDYIVNRKTSSIMSLFIHQKEVTSLSKSGR